MVEKILKIMEQILVTLVILMILLMVKDYLNSSDITNNYQANLLLSKKNSSDKCYYMTATAYSRHPKCISPRFDDGYTATGTKIREGVVAINVNLVNGEWVVDSVLKLGQKIYVTTMKDKPIGYFRVEDTGKFKVGDIRGASPDDLRWDRWNCDIYVSNINQARKMGCIPVKVYIIE